MIKSIAWSHGKQQLLCKWNLIIPVKVCLLGSCDSNGKNQKQIPDPRDFTFPETLRTFEAIKDALEALFEASHKTPYAKSKILNHKIFTAELLKCKIST